MEPVFKNQLFEGIAQQLGMQYKKYTTTYHPSLNGKMRGFSQFLKSLFIKACEL